MVDFYSEGTTIKNFDGTNNPKMKLIKGNIYKIIETDKSSVAKSGIVFMEAIAMEYARRVGLPSPLVTDILCQNGHYIFATKYLDYTTGSELIKKHPNLEDKLTDYCELLRKLYSEFGLERKMDLKDMLVKLNGNDIDSVIPVDFERLKFNDNLQWNIIYEICNEWNIVLPNQYLNLENKNKCK